ncbi:hypothetical protein Rleg4DRAFT_2292 [Rhizobium leguminosarum bv. trifolii WSM2297]|uniref:Uncharacterized protein n=1 Tax=Rhizobium leguminosarum bv. trifolii WSM2297 TaxID=754762 RepID=J0CBY0_RHILT|nr:hypothetical protein [Rhizobium leguminosarum]EJC80657.1 hypothetical protein Rleg4DRAFT_2292 [Rhizobium leguminosarum bv. trifolii WSM2297]
MWVNLTQEDINAIVAITEDDELIAALQKPRHPDATSIEKAAVRLFDSPNITAEHLVERTVNGGYVAGVFWVSNTDAGVFVDHSLLKISYDVRAKLQAFPDLRIRQILLNGVWTEGELGDLNWTFEDEEDGWTFALASSDQRQVNWSHAESWPQAIDRSDLPDEENHDSIILSILRAIACYRRDQEEVGRDEEVPMLPETLADLTSWFTVHQQSVEDLAINLRMAMTAKGMREMSAEEALQVTSLLISLSQR